MASSLQPNPDGDDFEHKYRYLLVRLRDDPFPEEVILRRVKHLKEEVFPFLGRLHEVREKEAEELMAVYLKYNGPDGILKRYSQEYDEIKAMIAASEDTILLKDLNLYCLDDFSAKGAHHYPSGKITYDFEKDRGSKVGGEKRNSDSVDETEHVQPKPTINLVPFAGIDGVPHHHNMNPDDDPAWNVLLLEILHRLMAEKDGKPFIDEVDETEFEDYYPDIVRPRCLKFIEQGLKSDTSVGYGATAFFNDMHLLFWNCRYHNGPQSDYTTCAVNLETLMKALLREMGPLGERLLPYQAQYDAIDSLGLEGWADPEWVYFVPPFNRRLHSYKQEYDLPTVKHFAREQFRLGQERVRKLRKILATTESGTGQGADDSHVEGEAQPGGESRKRPREEDADATEEDPNHEPKRQRSLRDATPGPSNAGRLSPRRASAERLRASADNATDDVPEDEDAEVIEVQEPLASKQKQPTEEPAYSGAPGSSPGAGGSSYNVPSQAGRKRARTPEDDDSEGDDVEAEDGHGPEGSKRRRLMKGTPSVSHHIASPEAVPATPRQATPGPGDVEPGSAQSHLTSPAGPPTPQPVSFPTQYAVPSSSFLKFSRNAIPMSKIVKMGKKRPWLFSYKTAEGYGIYAFVTCPRGNCKHHFSSHPLRDYRAQDHILGCNQQIRDERDMVRQYARQVIKDEGRKSDLTIDWARKSNLHLLPADQQDNHPENFPLSPADDDDDDEEEA